MVQPVTALDERLWPGWLYPLDQLPVAAIDLETTGLDAAGDRIIELAVVRSDRPPFTTLVRPGAERFDPGPHGLVADDLCAAPPFAALAETVRTLLSGCLVVGHYVEFDLAFLTAEFRRAGIDLAPLPFLCTAGFARLLGIQHERTRLTAVCDDLGIELARPHRALPDALAAWRVFAAYRTRALSQGATLARFARLAPDEPSCASWRHPPLSLLNSAAA